MSRQAVYDALKKAREEGEAWTEIRGWRVRIVPGFDRAVTGVFAIVRTRNAPWKVDLATVIDKDGLKFDESNGAYRRGRWGDILATVVEAYREGYVYSFSGVSGYPELRKG